MGRPFIDEAVINNAKRALVDGGLEVVEHDRVIASKGEARECLGRFKKADDVDAVVLFSGTWVWAAHLIAAVRDFAGSGKGIVLWTHPGSQGWRPVGGLVIQGALREIGIEHRFVYGDAADADAIARIVSYCRAAAEKNRLNMSTLGAIGGRGMGQTCGAADPSQWMCLFGIDIDSRDAMQVIEAARAVKPAAIAEARGAMQPFFSEPIPTGETADRSIALYLALKKVMAANSWDFYTIQSFPGMGDYYSATCFAQSMILNEGIATSTLSDFNTCLTVRLLTDFSADPVYYGDLQHIEKKNREIKIIGDGACAPSLACEVGPAKFAEHGIPTEGEAGGLSIDLVCKAGEGVLARLGRTSGEFEMVLTRCTVFEPPPDRIAERRRECGIPFWPHAFVTVHCDIEELLQNWKNEYACLGYGAHLYEDITAFCELTGIRAMAL
jgi:L-fucose isomerase